jgi:hypothetical protein
LNELFYAHVGVLRWAYHNNEANALRHREKTPCYVGKNTGGRNVISSVQDESAPCSHGDDSYIPTVNVLY